MDYGCLTASKIFFDSSIEVLEYKNLDVDIKFLPLASFIKTYRQFTAGIIHIGDPL